MKKYIIIAGVNGAGKSTLFSLVNSWCELEKINLDEIVRKNGDWRNTSDLLYAGKIAVQKINDCFKNDISFSQETTLCGNTVLRNIDKAKELGFLLNQIAEVQVEQFANPAVREMFFESFEV